MRRIGCKRTDKLRYSIEWRILFDKHMHAHILMILIKRRNTEERIWCTQETTWTRYQMVFVPQNVFRYHWTRFWRAIPAGNLFNFDGLLTASNNFTGKGSGHIFARLWRCCFQTTSIMIPFMIYLRRSKITAVLMETSATSWSVSASMCYYATGGIKSSWEYMKMQ